MNDWKEEILKKWKREKKTPTITDEIRDRLAREFKGEVSYKEPMSQHTSIRAGGVADVYLKPLSQEDLIVALKIAREKELPIFVLGSGSNTLVKDGGFRGFVIAPGKAFQECQIVKEHEGEADIEVGAGVGITRFVYFVRDAGLTGVEELVGIPGSIGGAIFMNAGARGREIKDVIREVTLINQDLEIQKIPREKLEFEYRRLKIPRSHIILSGLFRLTKGEQDKIEEKVKNFQQLRVDTQPLNYPNLGSIFKNPQPQKKGEVVTGAAKLIEETGLKNIRVGGARISEKHANFIINEREATAKDILILIKLVREKVKEATGVVLETEIKIVGED